MGLWHRPNLTPGRFPVDLFGLLSCEALCWVVVACCSPSESDGAVVADSLPSLPVFCTSVALCCVAAYARKYACCWGPYPMSGDTSVQGDVRSMLLESTCKVYTDSKGRFCGSITGSWPVMCASAFCCVARCLLLLRRWAKCPAAVSAKCLAKR